MDHYAGIDVSLERSSVCVVDATGRIIREAKVASEPEALVRFFRELGLPLTRVGLEAGIGAMLRAREGLRAEFARLHRRMLAIVRDDAVCRRLMTVPGVGALVAITFKTAVDDPARFRTAEAVGAHFGLTPKRYQSGETDVTGGISKVGDAIVRTALYEAANAMLTRTSRGSGPQRRALCVAKRRGMKRA